LGPHCGGVFALATLTDERFSLWLKARIRSFLGSLLGTVFEFAERFARGDLSLFERSLSRGRGACCLLLSRFEKLKKRLFGASHHPLQGLGLCAQDREDGAADTPTAFALCDFRFCPIELWI
jgi:hypothetical protein